MIAGGTGLTPMIQIIRAVLRNPADKTTITLIYANVNSQDILLKDDLDQLVNNHSPQFKLFYVLNNPLRVGMAVLALSPRITSTITFKTPVPLIASCLCVALLP